MLLARLVDVSIRLRDTRARLEKVGRLAECLRALPPDEVATGASWLAGELPQGRVGVGWALVGSLPDGGAPSSPTLRVAEVDAALGEIAAIAGAGATAARARALGALFARATADERTFLRGLLLGELRQGAQEGLVVEAIARAAEVPPAAVRRAVMLAGDVGRVAAAALADGAAGLARFGLVLFRPVQPMLAETAPDAEAALAARGAAAAEYKLDGARVQVHRDGDDVRVYTRSLHEVTARVPEVVEAVRALPVRRIVLDGETLVQRPGGRPADFQTTMRRFGRRLDVDRLRAELPLAAAFFDCLHLDGEDLIDRPTAVRWDALAGTLPPALLVPRRVVGDPEALDAFAREALATGHEGVMVKALDVPYAAGRRGGGWSKLKPAHSLDLVVLAVEWGSGRRRGWLSNLHLGARDPGTGGFVMLGKTFKGMTDEMLRWQTERLLALEIGREGHVVHVRPELVVEVAFDGVQASPQYPGGVALRFARVKRYRPDKPAAEADPIDAVLALRARSG